MDLNIRSNFSDEQKEKIKETAKRLCFSDNADHYASYVLEAYSGYNSPFSNGNSPEQNTSDDQTMEGIFLAEQLQQLEG